MTEISTLKPFSIIPIGIFFPSLLLIPSGPQKTANMNNTSCITPWSIVLSCQPTRRLGPDPPYFLSDHFWDKSSKSNVNFLDCAVAVTSILQRSTTKCWHTSVKSEMLGEWWGELEDCYKMVKWNYVVLKKLKGPIKHCSKKKQWWSQPFSRVFKAWHVHKCQGRNTMLFVDNCTVHL